MTHTPDFFSKIKNKNDILDQVNQWRDQNKKIVFTNGCFDIMHIGHARYLDEARCQGNVLIVGVNSDSSVTRLKGSHRPINPIQDRLALLAALDSVSAVIEFEEDTPYNLIATIMPDVLVKGGDWRPEQIIGSDIVLNNGGLVRSLQFVDGKSTTSIEQKIIQDSAK